MILVSISWKGCAGMKPPNGGVDAAARINSPSAAPVMMRNTPPPLASNDLLYRLQGSLHVWLRFWVRDSLSEQNFVSIGVANRYFTSAPGLIYRWMWNWDTLRHEFSVERIDIGNQRVDG